MGRGSRAATVVVATWSWSACSDASPGQHASVVDSAGVQVVTNLPDGIEAAEAWSMSRAPLIDIGSGADPEVPLFRVTAVLPLNGDRVAIGMTTPPRVLVVEADGSVAATLGREGDGPGEFAGIGSLVPLGDDSVAVWDPERRRISVFTLDGRFRREAGLEGLAPLSWIAAPNTAVLSARTYLLPAAPGSLVLFSVGLLGPSSEVGARRLEAPSYRISADGDELARLGEFPGEATFESELVGQAPMPLGPDLHGATWRDDFIVGTAESPEFRRYSPNGTLEQIVRWPDHDRTASGPLLASWTEFVEAWLESMPRQERIGMREVLDAIPRPETFPAYGSLVTDDDGRTWVGAYQPGQLGLVAAYIGRLRVPSRRWLVFDVEGSLAAVGETPEGFRLYAVRENRAWGVFTDELDVESVRAYEIVKGVPLDR